MENTELEEMVVEEVDDQLNVDSEIPSEEFSEDEEDVISIEGEAPPIQEEQHKAPEWVKDVRRRNRELNEEVKRLKAQVEQKQTVANVTLPAKPKLEDFDYDSDLYDEALENWYAKREEVKKQEAEAQKAVEAQKQQWQGVVDNYTNSKKSLRVQDYDLAEGVVEDALTLEQQAVILQGASNPATVVYALGKNKTKLDELANIKDPIKFAFAVAELQSKLKVERRNAPPPPEKVISGSARGSGVDSTLEALRKEAERTGDMTKVVAYKQQMKKKDR
ncbi:MAG TPA: hypothetical protein VFM18_03440 [Methanosarcina sp.]|nr:hypothetical protein [Methanosarcina sp.]